MTTALSLVICDTVIHQDNEGRYFLNDLHKAAGGHQKDRPNYFLENKETQGLIAELSRGGIPASDKINHLEPIRIVKSIFISPRTFVVEELVYAYAMWISPAFHLQVIRSYAALAKGLQPAPSVIPTNIEARMERMEGYMEIMASNLCTMADVSVQQAQKLDVTARYIGLLEVNQKGTVKITRTVEAEALALAAQGVSMTDIAKLVRVSRASVSLLVRGKYPWSYSQAALPPASVQDVADSMIKAERAALLARLAKLDGAE